MNGWSSAASLACRSFKLIYTQALLAGLAIFFTTGAQAEIMCNRTLTVDVVAIDMPLMFNRLGAQNINGMMYALKRDVINIDTGLPLTKGGSPTPGHVALRPDKRPRPLVLRMGAEDCMTIKLTNLLHDPANPFNPDINPVERSLIPFEVHNDDQVKARQISLRFQGTELVGTMADDGSNVGLNASSLIGPGGYAEYKIYAPFDGAFLGVSYGGTIGGEGLGGQTASGLWAVLNVNPKGSAFYRSLLTNEELAIAAPTNSATGHPIVNYEATYPDDCDGGADDLTPYGDGDGTWCLEGKAGLPVVNMVVAGTGEMVHTAIDAIVAYGPGWTLQAPGSGPHTSDLGHFPPTIYPLESVNKRNPTVPNRLEPFRELTVAFHDEVQTTQVFPDWYNDPVLGHTLHGVRDSFMINYGSGGIGSEIIANRIGVGPMHDCVNCAYEEFFLAFSTVGEVGQLTDIPANFGLENCNPNDIAGTCGANGPKANYVLYPTDPSNVHHGYTGDATAFRNLHAGPGEQHVFHLHNNQWLFNADDDNSNYLDAQGLGPGSGYAYWINFGGGGNRNKTSGDAIFHCHFYPHFAQGMWEMWRLHDTFEPGTELKVTVDGGGVHTSFTVDGLGLGNGTPAPGARALPDGEIVAGAPTPAVVPLPGRPMAPMPAAGVTVVANSNMVDVCIDNMSAVQVLRNASDGECPIDSTPMPRPVGSLVKVNRTVPGGVYGDDAILGPDQYGVDDGEINPGYPFWIAGMEHTIGNRPTTPPLDMITAQQGKDLKLYGGDLWQHDGWDDPSADNTINGWDGGLPRFALEGYSAGGETIVAISRLDMSKETEKAKPVFFPEEGTDLEQIAMGHHSQRCHSTTYADQLGTAADCPDEFAPPSTANYTGFLANGALPIAGAPFQEPCIDDRGDLLTTGMHGSFFGSNLVAMQNDDGLTVTGSSPFSANSPRVYKAANVQFDAVFNKLGYHFPQQRIITLWQDVVPTITQERPPEPFVLRINTFDCTQYVHSNVVPKNYELDDYQVRTPTDIIGQHIHLPKWDLTSADGSANGWNYEDGTLSPEAVVEMIEAINHFNDKNEDMTPDLDAVLTMYDGVTPVVDSYGHSLTETGTLEPSDHPFFGLTEFASNWVGARSTMQRWFADPVVNVDGVDRGLGIIFTHDHYGPSTHQQVGLYATVLIEPAGSKWLHNETGTELYTRTGDTLSPHLNDGGPTSWQAAILTGAEPGYYTGEGDVKADQIESYREFYVEYTDFQHAYQPGVFVGMKYDDENPAGVAVDGEYMWTGVDVPTLSNGRPGQRLNITPRDGAGLADTFRDAIQPPIRKQANDTRTGFPVDIWEFPPECPGFAPRPCPEAITADDPGMYVVNYRNESLAARIYDPDKPGPDADPYQDCSDPANRTGCGTQADGKAGDLAFAMDSNVTRKIAALNNRLGLAPATYNDGVCAAHAPGVSVFCPPITQPTALSGGDPFTPTMRAYDGDNVKVKMQAGGQEEEHATSIHGLKWLQGGSGFGEAKNSGWRNSQSGGISEQFTLNMPVYADYNQRGNQADYAYTFNGSVDGWTTGTWGILRSYKGGATDGLYQLPNNAVPGGIRLSNAKDFDKVCPKYAPDGERTINRDIDITAVSVNDIFGSPTGVNVTDLFPGSHVGASPVESTSGGGTLVYNPRNAMVDPVPAEGPGKLPTGGGDGPLHDPTGIIYVYTADLISDMDNPATAENESNKDNDPYCWRAPSKGNKWKYDPSLPSCKVQLRPEAAVEPAVLRAAAGDCMNVTLRNKVLAQAYDNDGYRLFQADGKPSFEDKRYKGIKVYVDNDYNGYDIDDLEATTANFDQTNDLATGNALAAMVRRDPGAGVEGMTSFNNNLMQPSAWVGLHPQLVEYDITRSDGTNVGQNPANQAVAPGSLTTYQWYAGHIDLQVNTGGKKPTATLVATPIEFGGFNIMPADQIEQGQKGLFGAGVIYPYGSTWEVDTGTNTAATVTLSDGITTFRDFTTIAAKGASMFYADSYPVENLLGEGSFGIAEDAQDMGHMNINYGNEAMWFRYGKNPTQVSGNAMCNGGDPNSCLGGVDSGQAALAYSNSLNSIGEPETPVFTVGKGQAFRMHVLMPFAPGRGSTYDLHGHVWQRDPYVCPDDSHLTLDGKCSMGATGLPQDGSVGSQALGNNPIGFHLGGIESWFGTEHYEIVISSAGGTGAVPGDYLFRDHMGLGNAGGLWGIVRVEDTTQ